VSTALEAILDAPARSVWAYVRRPAVVRAAPAHEAPVLGRLAAETDFGTREVVLVLDRVGRWLSVRSPLEPNGTTGWIARNAVDELRTTRRALVVDTAGLSATLLRDGEVVWSAPIATGNADWPTPTGDFYVRLRYVPSPRTPLYGPFAFVTSGIVPREPWPGARFVSLHGTNRPELIPGRVSAGCIRVTNEDVLELRPLLGVGTPVTIV
jgi:lipoprotein-anchoring transpeptidase ErfK/SrfK